MMILPGYLCRWWTVVFLQWDIASVFELLAMLAAIGPDQNASEDEEDHNRPYRMYDTDIHSSISVP
jgi:hypothetical protein